MNTLILQPVSGATLTVQYGNPVYLERISVITLVFPGLRVDYALYIKATAIPQATLSSLSCSATCGDDCTAPTLPASGQTDADPEFSTGTTYTFTCSAAVPGSATTTKTFSLVVEGKF